MIWDGTCISRCWYWLWLCSLKVSLHNPLFNIRLHLFYCQYINSLDLSNKEGAQAWTYHYNTGPNQRWLEARQWCQTHFTNMVPIRSQKETEFLNNLLPFNPKYYWIGIHKVAGVWTWAESNQNVSVEDQNWATAEPDTIAGQDCVEIYIKRETDTAKWNNEKCRNKKGTVCYNGKTLFTLLETFPDSIRIKCKISFCVSVVSCAQESCSSHADCVETVGNYTCKCHPGFQGPRCEDGEQALTTQATSWIPVKSSLWVPTTFEFKAKC